MDDRVDSGERGAPVGVGADVGHGHGLDLRRQRGGRRPDGGAYPATMFLTGANDPRVEPWHSRKMTARLQAANKSEHPILLRTSTSAGHGIGTALSERIKQQADFYSFLFAQLGMKPAK